MGSANERNIGEGMLFIHGQETTLPLTKTQVWGRVNGLLAEVRVAQTFRNNCAQTIEAIYVFPLPQRAAVHSLKMIVGDREIDGEVREREEGRQAYEAAKNGGVAALLLEQERPNIFTVSVANIRPDEEIVVDLRYHEKIVCQDGEYRFLFPLVVSPRYCPPDRSHERETVADSERIAPPLLPPGMRSGHTVAIELDIDAGLPIDKMKCLAHQIDIARVGDSKAHVALRRQDEIANKDFVFVYRLAGAGVATAFFTNRRPSQPGYFLAHVEPPRYDDKVEPAKREMIFVIDRSGSMGGTSIVQARRALRSSLRAINPGDTFTIIPFDDVVEKFSPQALPFTQEQLDAADRYIDTIEARGGTDILPALQTALRLPQDRGRLRLVVFLTDGSVGNEDEVLRGVKKELAHARIYTFGIGSAVNRYLLEKLAQVGRGFFESVMPQDDIEEVVRRFGNKIAMPYWTDVELEWQGTKVADVYPTALPDLFIGESLWVVGRYLGEGSGKLVVKGKQNGKPVRYECPVDLPVTDDRFACLPMVWARCRIDHLNDLERENKKGKSRYRDEIISLALEYGVASNYTSLVAVEKKKMGNDGDNQERCIPVHVPTELPDGMDYQALFGKGGGGSNANMTRAGGYGAGAAAMYNLLCASPAPTGTASNAMFSTCSCVGSGDAGAPAPEPTFADGNGNDDKLSSAQVAALCLRYLTRIQNADGSWGKEEQMLLTAAAIVAFTNLGHSDRQGDYANYLRRAIKWLKNQPLKSEEAVLVYFWAMAVTVGKNSGDVSALQSLWPRVKNIAPSDNLYKTLKYYCILEAENAGLKIEYPTVLGPAMAVPDVGSAAKFLESVLLNHFQQGGQGADELLDLVKSKLVTAGDREGRVELPCGEAAATVGAALLFSWK